METGPTTRKRRENPSDHSQQPLELWIGCRFEAIRLLVFCTWQSQDFGVGTGDFNPMSEEEASVRIPKLDKEVRDGEVNTATAILSLKGPCQGLGDIYLACVATAGLGQCRSLRASFEKCCHENKEESLRYLNMIGTQVCPDEEDKELCAALVLNQQIMLQAYPPSDQK